jgi:hypothetical protein
LFFFFLLVSFFFPCFFFFLFFFTFFFFLFLFYLPFFFVFSLVSLIYARPARQRKPPARTMSLADEVEPPSPGRKKARAEAGALTDFKSEDD